jgi:hypothetical protein
VLSTSFYEKGAPLLYCVSFRPKLRKPSCGSQIAKAKLRKPSCGSQVAETELRKPSCGSRVQVAEALPELRKPSCGSRAQVAEARPKMRKPSCGSWTQVAEAKLWKLGPSCGSQVAETKLRKRAQVAEAVFVQGKYSCLNRNRFSLSEARAQGSSKSGLISSPFMTQVCFTLFLRWPV